MKTLYLDCGMGAAGDMLTAALLELLPDPDAFIEELNRVGIPDVEITRERVSKCGIGGTHVTVKVNGTEEEAEDARFHGQEHHHHHEREHHHAHEHEHHHAHEHEHTHGHTHHHSGMHEIEHIVRDLKVSEKVQKDVLGVYRLIAQAESIAHGVPVTDIHFHEVGTMDAVADITAFCLLMEKLAPDQVVVSPVHVGSGHVHCAHGILPVPAPATACILRDVPIYGGSVQGELCTPTGAALLKYFAASFGDMPVMKTTAIGYGCGKKDFEAANCVRALLGETADRQEAVYELNCNVDDMTAEELGFAMDRLFDAGALEVFTAAVGMKKSRPGTLLCVLCEEQARQAVVRAIFRHTTTIGVRESVCNRYVLNRAVTTVDTPYGQVRRKESAGYGVVRSKLEYDDLAKIAREQGMSLRQARELAERPPAPEPGVTKEAVIEFFDRLAPAWDDELVADPDKIGFILDKAGVGPGSRVLDVACGTGVLFPYYAQRGAAQVTAVDISPKMAGLAAGKVTGDPRFQVICGDIEGLEPTGEFDCCVVYNAFPHFPEPERLICKLAGWLRPGGRLTVAHGMSLHDLDHHHAGHAAKVSRKMLSARSLAGLFAVRFQVDTVLSDDEKYVVSGTLLPPRGEG